MKKQEKKYCPEGAHISFPTGTIHRIEVGSTLCLKCPEGPTCNHLYKLTYGMTNSLAGISQSY